MTNLPNNKQYQDSINKSINQELTELKKALIAKKGGTKTLEIIKKLNTFAADDYRLDTILKYL